MDGAKNINRPMVAAFIQNDLSKKKITNSIGPFQCLLMGLKFLPAHLLCMFLDVFFFDINGINVCDALINHVQPHSQYIDDDRSFFFFVYIYIYIDYRIINQSINQKKNKQIHTIDDI